MYILTEDKIRKFEKRVSELEEKLKTTNLVIAASFPYLLFLIIMYFFN